MTDRELLEKAAKAAGLTVLSWLQEGYPYVVDENDKRYGWNPLVFDSDALRLMVKLKLSLVQIDDGLPQAIWEENGKLIYEPVENHYAAARRAIVRAAAAMADNPQS